MAARLTQRTVNDELVPLGYRARLEKANGYLYFFGGEATDWRGLRRACALRCGHHPQPTNFRSRGWRLARWQLQESEPAGVEGPAAGTAGGVTAAGLVAQCAGHAETHSGARVIDAAPINAVVERAMP